MLYDNTKIQRILLNTTRVLNNVFQVFKVTFFYMIQGFHFDTGDGVLIPEIFRSPNLTPRILAEG